ncbi:MAG: D-alanine--D-alanine ligase [Gammaproteobacteria bacterium]|nr:D-alanine--D-alanine ligase [Gammaproteobacteria bacterium]MDH3856700.1 D-alanine--D-alanine ligase [Gammaproteobacteria bacterium]
MVLSKPAPDSVTKCGRVAVLMGGQSAEREVSLNSGNAVYEALLAAGVDAVPVDLQAHAFHQLADLKADRVFNVLHGRGGEDGTIQAVLEFLGIPYTGSGVCSSALTMDKVLTKKVMRCSGIPTPDFFELDSETDCEQLLRDFGLPVFIKPILEGSSIGMTPVHQESELFPAWKNARRYGDVFAERFIDGTEYTAGFVGDTILPLIKLDTPHEFYDYDAKYLADDTVYTCPCDLDDASVTAINEIVLETIRVTGVRDWGRVDLILDQQQQPWVIEVNTVPGMTDHSLVPMAGRAAGLEMPDLVVKILETTLAGGKRNG